ncbi:MAG: hypothetical protein ACRD3R_13265, partial [Terriglobales bacterium]
LEVVMATTECDLDSLTALTDMDRHVRLMTAATGPEGILNAVNDYLAGWSVDRIRNLQKIDGGWGPFDERQQPAQLCEVADVPRIGDSVRRQCVALKEAGIAPTPELLELDLFFFFARQVVEDHEEVRSRVHTAARRNGDNRRRSDRQLAGRSF